MGNTTLAFWTAWVFFFSPAPPKHFQTTFKQRKFHTPIFQGYVRKKKKKRRKGCSCFARISSTLFRKLTLGELFHCDTCSAMLLMSLQFSSDFTQHHFNYVLSQSQSVLRKTDLCHRLLAKPCEAVKTPTWPGYSFRYC